MSKARTTFIFVAIVIGAASWDGVRVTNAQVVGWAKMVFFAIGICVALEVDVFLRKLWNRRQFWRKTRQSESADPPPDDKYDVVGR